MELPRGETWREAWVRAIKEREALLGRGVPEGPWCAGWAVMISKVRKIKNF